MTELGSQSAGDPRWQAELDRLSEAHRACVEFAATHLNSTQANSVEQSFNAALVQSRSHEARRPMTADEMTTFAARLDQARVDGTKSPSRVPFGSVKAERAKRNANPTANVETPIDRLTPTAEDVLAAKQALDAMHEEIRAYVPADILAQELPSALGRFRA